MSVTASLPIADTTATIAAVEASELARAAARLRHPVRLIDLAIDECERANLAAAGPGAASINDRPVAPVPPGVADLVVRLQLQAGEACRPPATAVEALDELFRLQARWLGDDDDDQVADVVVEAPAP